MSYTLIVKETGAPAREGEVYLTFRGERATLTGGRPPHKSSSTGRIYTTLGEFFPSVCGLEWVLSAPITIPGDA